MTDRHPISTLTHGILVGLIGLALTLTGCELVGPDDETEEPPLTTTSVLIGNGGDFGQQNGFLTLYDPIDQQAQDGADLGAFLHSLTLEGETLYGITNTTDAGRIEQMGAATGERVDQLDLEDTPRILASVDDETAYVTNADFATGTGFVSLYDRSDNTLGEATIDVEGNPEGIAVTDEKAFVALFSEDGDPSTAGDGTTLAVIDTDAHQPAGSIDLGCDGPNEVFEDESGEIVVVCQGRTEFDEDFQPVDQTEAQVVFVNPDTETVVDRIELDQQVGSANGTQTAFYDPVSEEVHVIGGTNTVFRFDTEGNEQLGAVSVPETEGLVGLTAIAYDGTAERIYAARLAEGEDGGFDTAASGGVVQLNLEGEITNIVDVGPSPSHIELRREAE